jgi:hypothetical protein
MQHEKSRRIESGRAVDDTDASTLEQDSADFYGRREKILTKITQGDFWIAIGLYLTMASVAFVIL